MPVGFRGAAKKRVAPTEQEMVSLVDKKKEVPKRDSKGNGKNQGGFQALNRMLPKMGGSHDELKVSLLDADSKRRPGGRPKPAPRLPWNRQRVLRYLGLAAASMIITFILFNQERDVHWENFNKMLHPTAKGDKKCFYMNKNHKDGTESCDCPDPSKAVAKTGSLAAQWKRHHEDMVATANRLDPDLDIVFLGDSIIERFSGTAGMGTQSVTGHKSAFDHRFSKHGGGRFEGKAFGTAQDVGPNLLWHLENGLINNLNPKIWFIMIGTNDLFTNRCSDDFVVASIMNVVKLVSERSPESLFVIHGIMPRLDNLQNTKKQFLGKIWKRAQSINNKLRRFCKKYHNFHYIQGGELMLVPSKITGRARLDVQMMGDGVHPTLAGFEKWADFVVDRLQKVMEDFDKFKAKLDKKKGK